MKKLKVKQKTISKLDQDLIDIQTRFCKCTKLWFNIDLNIFPMEEDTFVKEQKQETIQELNKKFGFVPTPIWLVDKMILKSEQFKKVREEKNYKKSFSSCDYCSGFGQMTVRILRYLRQYCKIDVKNYLATKHYFTQLQPQNWAYLVYIFGKDINLYAGDSMNINEPFKTYKGIVFYNTKTKKWEEKDSIKKLLEINEVTSDIDILKEVFINWNKDEKLQEILNKVRGSEQIFDHSEIIINKKHKLTKEQKQERKKKKEEEKLKNEFIFNL